METSDERWARCPYSHEGDYCTQCGWSRFVAPLDPAPEENRVFWPRNPLEGRPGEVMRLLASEDGKTFGYGYGEGWSIVFGSEQGDIVVHPGSWITKHPDGSITVERVNYGGER